MSTVAKSIHVRAAAQDVAAVVGDREAVMAVVSDFGRTRFIAAHEDGTQDWDVFIVLGAMHVGGRVLVDRPVDGRLSWHATSGIHNSVTLSTVPDGDDAVVTAEVVLWLEGALTGRLTAVLVGNVIGRFLDAMLEKLRHRVEYGE